MCSHNLIRLCLTYICTFFATHSSRIIVETVWPKQLVNGSWVGMGRLLIEEKADIAIVFTTHLPSRADAFTMLVPHLKNA